MRLFFKKAALALLLLAILPLQAVQAQRKDPEPVNAYFFTGQGCPHCADEKKFLEEEIKPLYPNFTVHEYEVWRNRSNAKKLKEVGQALKTEVSGVPFLVIGNQAFVGFSETDSPKRIEQRIKECSATTCPDSVASIVGLNQEVAEDNKDQDETKQTEPRIIKFPILGETDITKLSLPVLTVLIGALDGFNPCAMWALLFLISLLLGMKDRKRMWLLGTVFIITSGLVYFMFMAAWLNIFLFLGYIVWVRALIGVLALAGAGYSLKEYFTNKDSGCKITDAKEKRQIFDKLKNAVQQSSLWLSLGGIIILAFAVNLVELLCSAGLPAIYTQVLAMNDISSLSRYLYILGYIFFFMLDDLIVFFIAMYTLEMTGITTKYARLSRLIGGILMALIGLALIFKPEWLMFG